MCRIPLKTTLLANIFLFLAAAAAGPACGGSTPEELGRDLAGQEKTVAAGTFAGVGKYHAEGQARLVEKAGTYYLRFANDFAVDDGPDLYVYLGKDGHYSPSTLISVLGQDDGSRFYEIPSSIDISNYSEVWIWSRMQETAYAFALLK